ncbi:MAG: hypothetical protein Q8P32_01715 [Candidatus Komeilibacteria bacterium]|nr:hypothetical protein [Candidatus Komeilibacteria bacterium]
MFFTFNHWKLILTLLILSVVNNASWTWLWLNTLSGALFLLLAALAIGNWLFLKNSWVCKFIYGLLFSVVIASLVGTACFYLWQLDYQAYAAALTGVALFALLGVKKHPLIININFKFELPRVKVIFLALTYLLFVGLIFYLLQSAQTDRAIRSPWEVIDAKIFFLYFFATFLLFCLVKLAKTASTLWLVCLHALISFSVALIIYRLGFDYDPFIHRLNLDLILRDGTLLPKPFYYIGQYSLIIFLHRLLLVSVDWLDKLLIPIMAAIYLPATIYYAFKDNFKTIPQNVVLTALSLLLFPFAGLIVTTPQATANLFCLLAILLSLYYINHPKVSLWPLGLLVLMALTIHPLAGIPVFFFFVIMAFYQHRQQKFPLTGTSNLPKILHQSILWEIAILGILALPVAFIVNSLTLSELKVGLQTNWLAKLSELVFSHPPDFYFRPFISLADLIYTYGKNIVLLLFILSTLGLIFVWRHQQFKKYFAYFLGFLMVAGNYLLLKAMVSFFSLVSYEQINYPNRVLEISLYLLSPFILIVLYLFFKKLNEQSRPVIILSLTLLAMAMTFSWYLSYPRVDKITEDHGYSTSLTDVKTVNFIETIQRNRPYVVLAAQPVSAAALKELGFKYYYNNLFFYPVPTGGRLYGLYEELAYAKTPVAEVIGTVRFLTGVNDVYFVINDYWLNASDVIAEQQETADDWQAIDGKNYIFKYEK